MSYKTDLNSYEIDVLENAGIEIKYTGICFETLPSRDQVIINNKDRDRVKALLDKERENIQAKIKAEVDKASSSSF